MQLQNIGKLLELQGVKITEITNEPEKEGITAIVHVKPIIDSPKCPLCKGTNVIRYGVDGVRRIRHLNIGVAKCIIEADRQRLKCKTCDTTYTHEYEFVNGKERYTAGFKAQAYQISVGATVRHGAECNETPYSTIERFFKEVAMKIAPLVLSAAQTMAEESTKLILGIDDFAIRKGHNYNTGIHDLRGENLIGIAKGRKLEDLRQYMEDNPQLAGLNPYAVVMDLARGYHSFAAEFYPKAIRVADRFHVNRYILDALDEVRRRVGKQLSHADRTELNRSKHLLRKRNDSLDEKQFAKFERILGFSADLRAVYELKEQLIDWYDLSINHDTALTGYQKWLRFGYSLCIPEVTTTLKTFENWQDEIVNYHKCRFTNGIVEGRNAKIKALQRRHFFLHNRTFYEALIVIECNAELSKQHFEQLFA